MTLLSIINPPIQLTEPSVGMEGRFQLVTQGHKTFTFLESCRERCSREQEANKCSSHSCQEASSPFFLSRGSDLVLPQADKRPERLAHTQLGEGHAWSSLLTRDPPGSLGTPHTGPTPRACPPLEFLFEPINVLIV